MESLFFHIVLWPIGWMILNVKHRDKTKLKAILELEYDNNYANVARSSFLTLFIILLILLIFGLIFISVYRAVFPI